MSISRGKCLVDTCEYSAYSTRGYCRPHYEDDENGQPFRDRIKRCTYYDCNNLVDDTRRDRCPEHRGVCDYQDCGQPTNEARPGSYNRYCGKHAARQHRNRPMDDEFYIKDELPWAVDKYSGYMRRSLRGTLGSRKEFEHRVVMEEKLGRKLLPGENVHHLDGNRANNSPDNLELWIISQPAGQRLTDRIHLAITLLERYGYQVDGSEAISGTE